MVPICYMLDVFDIVASWHAALAVISVLNAAIPADMTRQHRLPLTGLKGRVTFAPPLASWNVNVVTGHFLQICSIRPT